MTESTMPPVPTAARGLLTKEGPRTPAGRAFVLALTVVQFALQLATWVSLARRDARDINGPKWMWFVASFINFVGPIAYLLGGRKLTP